MNFKQGLILILFALFIVTPVYGAGVDNINMPSVHFWQNYFYQKDTQGKSLFLFSESELNQRHTGNITVIKSDIIIKGDFTGNIYSYFSDVHIEEGAVFKGKIYTLSSEVYVDDEVKVFVEAIIPPLSYFRNKTNEGHYLVYNDKLHIIVIYLAIGILREGACLVILALKKGFLEQGSVLMVYEPLSLIQNGLIAYFIFLSMILIFFASVVGFPIAILIFIIAFFMVLVGLTSLNIFVGNTVLNRLNLNLGSYANMVTGGVLVEIISFVPYIRSIVNLVFMPILCLGILGTNITNGWLKKRYYEVDYNSEHKEKNTDIASIRNIILKDLD